MSDIRITLFGPLTVRVAGAVVELRGPQPRAVLARLAVAAGAVVSTDRIIDDIWTAEPPPKALGALQVHISNLRRVLEPSRERRAPARVLVSSPPGYALRLPPDAVDAWQFEALLRAADAVSEPAERARLLRAALDCCSGAVLPEFADTDWAATEATRLAGLRAGAVEQHAAVSVELGRETARHPRAGTPSRRGSAPGGGSAPARPRALPGGQAERCAGAPARGPRAAGRPARRRRVPRCGPWRPRSSTSRTICWAPCRDLRSRWRSSRWPHRATTRP